MVQDLAIFTLAIAVGFFFAVAFYESLSTRDVLVGPTTRFVRRFTDRRWLVGGVYLLTVVGLVPILVALWAIVLETALGIVGTPDPLGVAESAVAIVGAARVLAYVRQKTSHELAKLIPLALVLSLLIAGVAQLEDNLRVIVDDPFQSDLTVEMIAFIVALEIGLRLVNDATRGVVGAVAERRQRSSTPPDHGEAPQQP
jgi:hypothetical protein